jgi:hypothetical protein
VRASARASESSADPTRPDPTPEAVGVRTSTDLTAADPTETKTGSAATAGESDLDRSGWLPWIFIGLPFVIAFIVLAVRAFTVDWHPAHDFAFIELRTRDVGTASWPLVGPYSRFGWSHPGPLLFELLAVPYRLLGSRPEGLLVGAVLLNAASVAAALAVARRRGGMVLVATVAVVLGLLMRALGADVLISPWNPWVTVLPLVVFFLLAWSVAERDWVALPWAVFVGSFLVQTHVAYGLLTLVVAAAVAAFAWLTRPRDPDARRWSPSPQSRRSGRSLRTLVWVSGAVGIVMWLAPLIDLVVGEHNLARIVRYFLQSQPGRPGLRTTIETVANQTVPWGPWSTGHEPLDAFSGTVTAGPLVLLGIPLIGLAVGTVVTWRRRDRAGLSLIVIAAASLATAVFSVSRIEGALLTYLVRFTWAISALVWLAVLRALSPALAELVRGHLDGLDRRWSLRRAGLAAGAVAGSIVAIGLVTVPAGLAGALPPDDGPPAANLSRIEAAVVPVIEAKVAAAGGAPVLIRPTDAEVDFPIPNTRGVAAGLVPTLEHDGVPVRVVDDDWRIDRGGGGLTLFGAQRLDDGGPVAGSVFVVGADTLDTYVPPPGAEELIRIEDRGAVEAALAEQATLKTTFTAAGHADAADQLTTGQARWIPFNFPDLASYGPPIEQMVDTLDQPRVAVFWLPGR